MSRRARRTTGFALIETMVAIVILAVGLLGVAALLSQMNTTTTGSRYGGIQASLASEKLEDLVRRPQLDPAIATPGPGQSAGSIQADAPMQTVNATQVSYYDDVQISSDNGGITESVQSGNNQYMVTTHQAAGNANTTQAGNAPAPTADTMTFHRRWLIEQDVPVAGVRRITVLVTLSNAPANSTKPFQMSTVRP